MSSARFTVHTSHSPKDAMTVLTDFGPDRAKRWPNIDEAHFKVHEVGADWAEVTEGTAMGWAIHGALGSWAGISTGRHDECVALLLEAGLTANESSLPTGHDAVDRVLRAWFVKRR